MKSKDNYWEQRRNLQIGTVVKMMLKEMEKFGLSPKNSENIIQHNSGLSNQIQMDLLQDQQHVYFLKNLVYLYRSSVKYGNNDYSVKIFMRFDMLLIN